MIHSFITLLLCFYGIHSAQALPKVTTEKINGFQVDFVDVGAGDTFAAIFAVPIGTQHETGRLMGRAHLLEHLLHVGTRELPGYHTFKNILTPAGVSTNAATSPNSTVYFATANANSAELAIRAELGMLSGLEWSGSTIEKERGVVINEVVEEYMPQEGQALRMLPFLKLLPHDHPFNHPMLGSRESLEKLSINDLKELYYNNYGPRDARVALIGNFSDPNFLAKVKEWTGKYLTPANYRLDTEPYRASSTPLKGSAIPSLFSTDHQAPESEARLYVQTEHTKMSGILMEAPVSAVPKNPRAVELLADYLNSAAPGTLIHHLLYELEWISGGGGYSYRLNNRQRLQFQFMLTEKGLGHEQEINEMFFQTLRSLHDEAPDASFLNKMKQLQLTGFAQSSNSVDTFVDSYMEVLTTSSTMDELLDEVSAVTGEDIQRAARAFRPDQALYFSSGPEIADMVTDDQGFGRKFKLIDNRAALGRYIEAYRQSSAMKFAPIPKPVPLGPPPAKIEPLFEKSKILGAKGDEIVVDIRRDLPDAAISARFEVMPRDVRDLVASDIVDAAFEEHFSGELNSLVLDYAIRVQRDRNLGTIQYGVNAQNGLAARALAWRTNALASFVPNEGELRRAREVIANLWRAKYNRQMSASSVIDTARAKLDPFHLTALQTAGAAASLSNEEILASWQNLRRYANRRIVAAGAFARLDISQVERSMRELFKAPLMPERNVKLAARHWWNVPAPIVEDGYFPSQKGLDSYASLRAYRGPAKTSLKESMAFAVLHSLLHNAIDDHNRSDQKLGYVHQAGTSLSNGRDWTMMFFGGVEGPEQSIKMIAGWEHVLEQLRSGAVSDAKIEDYILDVLNKRSQIHTSAADIVANYGGGVSLAGDPLYSAVEIAQLKKLKPADIREVAEKYLLNAGVSYYQLNLKNCEQILGGK